MAEPDPIQTRLEQKLGPKPQPGFRMKILGQDIGPFGYTDQQYASDLHTWDSAAQHEIAKDNLTPVTRSQYQGVTGRDPLTTATESEFTKSPVTEPSSVPHFGLNPQGYGTPNTSENSTPAIEPNTGRRYMSPNSQYLPQENDPLAPQVRGAQGMQAPRMGLPQAPPTQTQGPLQPQAGSPVSYEKSTLDPQGQINPVQRDLYHADLYRQGHRLSGAGANAYSVKVQGLAQALMQRDPTLTQEEALAQANMSTSGYERDQSQIKNRLSLGEHRTKMEGIHERRTRLQEDLGTSLMDHRKFVDDRARRMEAQGIAPEQVAIMREQEHERFNRMVARAWMNQHANLPQDEQEEGLADMLNYINKRSDITAGKTPPMSMDIPGLGPTNIPFTGGKTEYTPKPGERKGEVQANPQPTPETAYTAQERLQAVTPPKVGEVRKGYRFKGGNPSDQKSWEKAQ